MNNNTIFLLLLIFSILQLYITPLIIATILIKRLKADSIDGVLASFLLFFVVIIANPIWNYCLTVFISSRISFGEAAMILLGNIFFGIIWAVLINLVVLSVIISLRIKNQ